MKYKAGTVNVRIGANIKMATTPCDGGCGRDIDQAHYFTYRGLILCPDCYEAEPEDYTAEWGNL